MFLTLAALLMWLNMGAGAWVEEPEPDWLGLLREAVLADDREAGPCRGGGLERGREQPAPGL